MTDDRDELELDQLDFYGRLLADPFFSDVPVELQRKGVTAQDVTNALGTLNEKSGKLGVFVLVLMPELVPDDSNTPSPVYNIKPTVQVFENPLFNLDAVGTGKSAEKIARRVRQLLHHFMPGRGTTFVLSEQLPIAAPPGTVSYAVGLVRLAADPVYAKVAMPQIGATSASAPATVTLTCATAGAAIYYTLNGDYPSHVGGELYTAPFVVSQASTIRAGAEKADLQQSNIAQLVLA